MPNLQKKKFFTTSKFFYNQLIAIAIPVALQNLINFSVAMADTVMVSQLSVESLAAASLGNKFSMIFTLFTFGLGSGANVLIAQYWGKKDKESIKHIITIMYRVLLVGAMIFSVVAVFFPHEAMTIFTKDQVVQAAGVEYLRIIGFSYFFAGFASATTTLWRSVGSVKIALVVYLSSLATNVFLNWVLIFGKLGAPALGMKGAAIGTLSARIVEVIIVLCYMAFVEKKIGYKLKDFFTSSDHQFKHFLITAGPVIVNEIIWGLGATVIAIIFGHMGPAVTAAEAVTSVLSQLVTIFVWGVGHASATIVGNAIGAGKSHKAKEYARTLMVLSIGLGVFSGLVVLLIRDPMISMFALDNPEAVDYARQMINVYAGVVVFQAITAVSLIGILRGAGNSRFVLVMDLLFMWVLCIPLGALAGLKFGWPVALVYAIIRSDEIFKALAGFTKVSGGDWIRNVTIAPDTAIEE